MITPYQDWIAETNAIAAGCETRLAERLSARLLDKSGPPPTADDINWLDLIIDAYSNAAEADRAKYAQVILDWLAEFQTRFGRTEITAQTVTLACSALSFWQACPHAFTNREGVYLRAFVSAYLDISAAFTDLPAPLYDAGTNLHAQIVRLYYTGPGSENLSRQALVGRWLGVPQDEAGRLFVRPNLWNNRYILEALAHHYPKAISYDWVHQLFTDSKALQETERNAFLEHTFTKVDLTESWTQRLGDTAQIPRDHFFEELRTKFRPDDFESIDETLRFLDQVFWLAGDEAGEFVKWKKAALKGALKEEINKLRIYIRSDKDCHANKEYPESSSPSDLIGCVMSLNIFTTEIHKSAGRMSEAKIVEETRKGLFKYACGLKN